MACCARMASTSAVTRRSAWSVAHYSIVIAFFGGVFGGFGFGFGLGFGTGAFDPWCRALF